MIDFNIRHFGHVLGSKKVSYSDFKKKKSNWNMLEVQKKTGINFVYESGPQEDVLNLSIRSSVKTLKNFNKKKIDAVIVVTQTAKNKLPSVACMLQNKLKLNKDIIAYDVNLGCSGFIFALSTLYALIRTRLAKNILLVCSDTYTKFLDEDNRTCRSIFSDSASSCIVSSCSSDFQPKFNFFTDGSGSEDLIENNNVINMNGSEVFIFTTTIVPRLFKNLLDKSNYAIDDIDHFVFHQASKLVLDRLILELDIPPKKFHINYNIIGNTVSASIPILLEQLKKKNKLKKNNLVMLIGFGVGLSAAGCIIKWK
jgi:3-oxoacyl-[acyl-carrier-protein] synthase-3